jgi:hypothetical protein
MKRNEIVGSLLKEGFSEKTLSKLTDKQINNLAERILGEETVMIPKNSPTFQKDLDTAKKAKKTIETYEEEMKGGTKKKKPSSGLSKEKKSEIVKKAKKGEDIGKKGKGFEKIVKKAKESGAKDPEAVAGSVMWKNVKRKNVKEDLEVKEWVRRLAESKYHTFTSKNEIMELIQTKLTESEVATQHGPNVKKGHNGIPEFMTYDSIATAAEPTTKPAPTKPKVNPGTKPKTPYNPGPGKNPKPKALKETE